MNKPSNITNNDWILLCKKYPNQINKMLKKIEKGYPIQYLIGYVDFYDCQIKVNKNVLIPRFETELLVDLAIKKIKEKFGNNKITILDCGTGSGCIAIKLKNEFPKNIVIGIDKSKKALSIAKKNAIQNDVSVIFKNQSFNSIKEKNIDVIISNPPYVGRNDQIDDNVKKYEPKKALFAKKNGLLYYEQILKRSISILNKNYLICFEIGSSQKNAITELIIKYYPNSSIEIIKDYSNKDRYVFITN